MNKFSTIIFLLLIQATIQGANGPSCPEGYQIDSPVKNKDAKTVIHCRNGSFKLQRHYEEGLLIEQNSKGEKINISYNSAKKIVAIKKKSNLSGKTAASCRYLSEKVRAVEGTQEYCQFLQLQWTREQKLSEKN